MYQHVEQALLYPGSIVTGRAALGLQGLPFLVETAPTTLVTNVARNRFSSQLHILRRGCTRADTFEMHVPGGTILVARPAAATVQALKELRAEGNFMEAVQLVDCVRRYLRCSPAEVRAAAKGKLDRRWLEKVLALSSQFADSPRETELRLLLSRVVGQRGLVLEEQVPVYNGKRLVTTFDLAVNSRKLGIMYDGQHHWEYEQRQRDARINLELAALGWTVARFAAATFRDVVPRVEWFLDRGARRQ